jgi:predicted enzyme related to lactoylglutathione lyase
MTEVTKHEPGSFSWAELATSDPQSAKKFYSGLFGWSIKDNPMGEDFVYTLLQIGGKDVAALYKMMKEQADQGVPPNWMCYVAVENADETAQKAKSLGGKVIAEPFDVMDYGRMAVIQDPEGAILSIWQPRTHAGVQRVDEPNTMCWCELSTRDAARAGKFYTGLFGWGLKTSDPAYHEILRGGVPIGGILPMTPEMKDVPAHWGLYFQVVDCDGAVAKAKALGGQVCMGPLDIPKTGRFAVLQDPQGAFFNVIKLDSQMA